MQKQCPSLFILNSREEFQQASSPEVFVSCEDASPQQKAKWDEKYAEITVDNRTFKNVSELSTIREARRIWIKGAWSDIHLPKSLRLKSLIFYECQGRITIGDGLSTEGISISDCPGIKTLPKDIEAQSVVVKNCLAFEEIGTGLVINRRGDWSGNGGRGLHVGDCPEFKTLHPAATINGSVSFIRVPSFMGLSPEIRQDERYECWFSNEPHGLRVLKNRDEPSNWDQNRAQLRAMWDLSEAAKAEKKRAIPRGWHAR